MTVAMLHYTCTLFATQMLGEFEGNSSTGIIMYVHTLYLYVHVVDII